MKNQKYIYKEVESKCKIIKFKHGLLTLTKSPHRVHHGGGRKGAWRRRWRIGNGKHFIGSRGGHAHTTIAALRVRVRIGFQSHIG